MNTALNNQQIRRITAFLALTVLAALAIGIFWTACTFAQRVKIHTDPFVSNPYFDIHVILSEGWIAAPQGLVLSPGTKGNRVYKLPLRKGEHVSLNLRFRKPPGGTNRLLVTRPDPAGQGEKRQEWSNTDFDLSNFSLDDITTGGGFFFIGLEASAPIHGPPLNEPLVTEFTVRMEPEPRPFNRAAAIILIVMTLVCYAALFFYLLPEAWKGLLILVQAFNSLRIPAAAAGLFLVLFSIFSVAAHREWRSEKNFDDKAALGNAVLLLENGFDVHETFFRSRIRPGLTAWLLPWAAFRPWELASSTLTPSDRKERLFYFYDNPGPGYGRRVYPELSAFFIVLAIVGLLALVSMGHRLGLPPLAASGLLVLGGFFFGRCLYNSISVSANFTTTVAAVALAVEAWRRPGWRGLLAAALGISFAALLTETTLIVITALLLYQFWTWRTTTQGIPHSLWKRFLFFWVITAILPLFYYGVVLDTGFREILDNHRLIYYAQEFHDFERLTPLGAIKVYWQAFGPAFPLALAGLVYLLIRRPRHDGDRFFICWFFGSLWSLNMPFLFTRFLVFSIPPFSYLTLAALAALLSAAPRLSAWAMKKQSFDAR